MDEEQQAGQEQLLNKIGDMAKSVGNMVSEMMKMLWQVIKVALKAVGKFLKWLISVMASNFYVTLIVCAIVVVLVVVICAVGLFMSAGYDSTKQTMSSIGGVTGTNFYGERFMYYDDEYTSQDLANVYLEFTYNILHEVNSDIAINIDFSKSYLTNSQIRMIATNFADSICVENNKSLNDFTEIIDHYGFTSSEQNIVLESISNYIVDNGFVTASKSAILNQLKNTFDAQFKYMQNVCKKIVIKDYILNPNETAKDIEKKNYFGFVYMPKEMVSLKYSSFVFKVDDEQSVDFSIAYTNGIDNVVLEEETADSSWFDDDIASKIFETEKTKDYLLNQFTAIDTNDLNYLSDGKTLFQMLKDNKFLTYFKDTAGDYTEDTLMKNINTGNYLYIQLSAESSYNFAESMVTVTSY